MEASEEALQAAEGPPSGSFAHADHPVSNNRLCTWDPLARPAHVRKPRNVKPEVVMRSVVRSMAAALPTLAAEGQWVPLRRATQFLLWLTHHAPGSASMFIAAKGTVRIQDAIRAATASEEPAAVGMLQPGTALLLQCVQLSEGAADLVVESQSVRLLLQLLLRPHVGPTTKRHIGGVLQALAATKLVYRDVLHGAGVVEVLMAALTDAAVLTDLLLVQELLWVLISLSDDDLVYKDDMREAGLPALLVSLLSVYQANAGTPELRPIAAQILRCLQLMAAGDEDMQVACVRLGLIRLLTVQLHLDIHQQDEPPLPAAAANILTLNSLPSTPKSPAVTNGGPFGGGGGVTPASPLRRSGSGSNSPQARPGSAGPGGRRGVLEPSIPEDEDLNPDFAAAGDARRPRSSLGSRAAAFASHGSEAAALRGLGVGPSPLQRLAAAALLRVVLVPVMSGASIEVLLHGMLLPALQMQVVGPRLSLAAEATCTLRALLAGSPQRAALAADAGLVPLIVQLLSASNLELATAAADVLTLLACSCPTAVDPLAPAAVAGLTDLLRECTAHSQSMGLARRHSINSTTSNHTLTASHSLLDGIHTHGHSHRQGVGDPIPISLAARRRSSLPAALDSPMSPIPEAGGGGGGALSPAEQASGAVWAAERAARGADGDGDGGNGAGGDVWGGSVFGGEAGSGRSFLTRQNSAGKQQQQQQQQQRKGRMVSSSTGGTPGQDHLTSRVRQHPSSLRGGSSSCLACGSTGAESCCYCCLSAAVRCLLLLLQPQQELQTVFVEGGGLELVTGSMQGLLGSVGPTAAAAAANGAAAAAAAAAGEGVLLGCLCQLLVPAVRGNRRAQDQVRQADGLDVLTAHLRLLGLGSSSAKQQQQQPQQQLQEVSGLASSVLQLLSVLVVDNSANKLAMREAGALACVVALLDLVLQATAAAAATAGNGDSSGPSPDSQVTEGVASCVLSLLAAALPDSPGSQLLLHSLGGTRLLLLLLRAPSNSPELGLATIHVLSLLANRAQPGALAEVTAGGLVAVVMNVLQQQAMAGVLVSEVCMEALPRLLESNTPGKHQALQYGVLPLLVHLLRSSPSTNTVSAAAHTLAVLAEGDTELQGQITAAGGLSALIDKLDTSNNSSTAAAPPEAQAAAASAAAAAAATAAAEVVAKAAAESEQQQQEQQEGSHSSASAAAAVEDGVTAAGSNGAAAVLPQLPGSQAAAAMAVAAAAAADVAVADAKQAVTQQHAAGLRVRVACLQAIAALAHDNSFTKNTARQQGIMTLLGELLQQGGSTLQAALLAEAAAAVQQQQHHSRSASPACSGDLEPYCRGLAGGSWGQLQAVHQHHLRVRTPRSSFVGAGSNPTHQQQQEQQQRQQQEQAVQLQLLVAAVSVLCVLCHGNHSNQAAAAAEGLIDALTSLAAAAMGARLETAGKHGQLLAGVFNALAAAAEFCTPNKLVAREAGAVDVASSLLLLVAEVPDVGSVLSQYCLAAALSACCGSVAALAQDCEDNQAAFLAHPDFLPALFRLMEVGDPAVATQAARALEFIAVRTEIVDDAEDRNEFEADTVMALIRVLSSGALTISGSGCTAAARAALTRGPTPPPPAAAVKEAAGLLSLVVEASDPSAQQAAAAAVAAAGGSSGSNVAAVGLGTAPAHPNLAPGARPSGAGSPMRGGPGGSFKGGGAAGGVFRHASLPSGVTAAAATAAAVDGTTTPPNAMLPDVVTDHTSGLAVLRTWSLPHGSDQPGQWSALVGRSAPAFQRLRSAVPPGPWKPFREQVSWLLLLLASKTAANRALVSRVQRTTLTPLAMQLENAERFAEQAAAVEAAAAAAGDRGATAAGRGWDQGGSSSRAAAPSPLQHHSRGSSRSGVADFGQQQQQQHASPGRSPLPSFSSSSSPDRIGAAAAAAAVAAAGGGSSGRPSIDSTAGRTSVGPSDGPSPSPRTLSPAAAAAAAAGGASGVSSGRTTPAQRAGSGVLVPSGEDDLSMLQAEVAFLGLMSGQSSRAATADRDP